MLAAEHVRRGQSHGFVNSGQQRWRRRRLLAAVAALSALTTASITLADTFYWDVNGTSADSGVTGITPDWANGTVSTAGTWNGTTTNWNSDPTGGGAGTLVGDIGAGNAGVFSAGNDAPGSGS